MTPDELGRMLALVGAYLPSALRTRFFALLPEGLGALAQKQVEEVSQQTAEQLSVVERSLLSDLQARFGDEEVTAEIEALPLRVVDVLALVLRKTSISKQVDMIRRLPEDVQSEVFHLIAAQSWAAWERRLGPAELEWMFSLRDALDLSDFEASPQLAAEILRQIQNPADVRRNLTYLYEKEPDSTGYIQNHLYGFESLVKLPDRELQGVLKRVDHWDLILAMRSVPANVRRKIMSNLSQRRAALFEEDEATLEEVDDAQVEMVQHQILDRARLLYEAGDLHTYLGSIAGQESDLEQVTQKQASGGSTKKDFVPPSKKAESKKYAIGLLVALLIIAGGWGGMYWARSFHTPPPVASSERPALADQSNENETEGRDSKKTAPKKSAPLGTAAVVSGRALLMSGESVRPLNNTELQVGDRVKTDAQGSASVDLANDVGKLQIEPQSEVAMEQADEAQHGVPRLDLRVGNIWVQVKDPALEVTSPLVQVTASEGALYHLRITLNATTVLTVHGGTVWVQEKNGGGLHVLGLGERLRVEPDGDVYRDRHVEVSKWVGER